MAKHLYWEAIRHIRRLEPDEEAALWEDYKERGDLSARGKLIESYQLLVFKLAAAYGMPEPVGMDLAQEGTVGLIEAAEKYDHRRGVAFSLFAIHRIRGRMLNFLAAEGRKAATEVEDAAGAAEQLADSAPGASQIIEARVAAATITQAMRRLPPKEQVVLAGVLLHDQEPASVAQELDVSVSHVYRLQKQGIRRLRGMLSRWMQQW